MKKYFIFAIILLSAVILTHGVWAATACVDSDGGVNSLNYNVKGTVVLGGDIGTEIDDSCLTATTLSENYCGSDASRYSTYYNCPNGCSNGACQANATPTTVNHLPVGYFDEVTNAVAYGWAVDPDVPGTPISVDLYLDGTANTGGVLLTRLTANSSSPDVTRVYPTYTGNHRFVYTIPARYADGRSHTLYAYGIDSANGPNFLLNRSPKTFTIVAPTSTAPISTTAKINRLANALNALQKLIDNWR